MRYLALVLAILLVSLSQAEAQEYRLNPGDVVSVSVWKEPDLQSQLSILPDGTMSFPLAGQVQAAGKTVGELESALASRIERYVPDPVITVSVINPAGNKIYLTGEVNRPGVYPLDRPMSVLQAIALAGGVSPFASEGNIKIVRSEGGEVTTMSFDYNDVQSGRDLSSNIMVMSGDTIVVPEAGLF